MSSDILSELAAGWKAATVYIRHQLIVHFKKSDFMLILKFNLL